MRFWFLLIIPFLSFANPLAYTQNNPPSQHHFDANIKYNTPIMVNADLLLGYVISSQIPAYWYQKGTPGQTKEPEESYIHFNNKEKLGFRCGIGIGVQNRFNLSLQWMYLTGGNESPRQTFRLADSVNGYLMQNLQLLNPAPINRGTDIDVKTDQFLRLHHVDFVVQTAAWKAAEHVRFQPFGGVRYLGFKRSCNTEFFLPSDEHQFAFAVLKLHATGVFFGTDVKYLLSKHFHFFSSGLVAILAGHQSRDSKMSDTVAPNNVNTTIDEHFEIGLWPQYELHFGFAFDYAFRAWLLSLRVGYELSSFLQAQITDSNRASPVPPNQQPLRVVDVIKHKAFIFGFTLGF